MQLYRLLRNMQTVFAIFLVKCRKMWGEGADKNPEWAPPPAGLPLRFSQTAEAAGMTGEEIALMTEETGGAVVRFKLVEAVESFLQSVF